MVSAPQKSDVKRRKMGLSLESEIFEAVQTYAKKKFKGNRSAAVNYLLSTLQKKSP